MDHRPIRKTQTKRLEREHARKQAMRRDTLTRTSPFVIAAAVVLFIGMAIVLVLNQTAAGTPRLQVDQERIDLGKRIFNQSVRATFSVKNVGAGTLTLEAPQVATVLQGC